MILLHTDTEYHSEDEKYPLTALSMSTSIHILIGWVDVEEIHGDTTYKTFKKTRKKHENKQSCMLEITYLVSGVFRFQINFLKRNT